MTKKLIDGIKAFVLHALGLMVVALLAAFAAGAFIVLLDAISTPFHLVWSKWQPVTNGQVQTYIYFLMLLIGIAAFEVWMRQERKKDKAAARAVEEHDRLRRAA